MAKKLNVIISEHKMSIYGSTENLMFDLAVSANASVKVEPTLKSNGNVSTTAKYQAQRAKRLKPSEVVGTNLNNSTSGDLAILDSFSVMDWESTDFATGNLHSIGIKTRLNEQFDPESVGSIYQTQVESISGAVAIKRHEELLSEIITNGSKTAALTPTSATAGASPIRDALQESINTLMNHSDEFIHTVGKPQMVILINPLLTSLIEREIGVAFRQEAPIYTTGLKSRFNFVGVPVIEDVNLNKFEATATGGAGNTRVAFIVATVDAIVFKASEIESVDHKMAVTRFVGETFYSIAKLLDPKLVLVTPYNANPSVAKLSTISA